MISKLIKTIDFDEVQLVFAARRGLLAIVTSLRHHVVLLHRYHSSSSPLLILTTPLPHHSSSPLLFATKSSCLIINIPHLQLLTSYLSSPCHPSLVVTTLHCHLPSSSSPCHPSSSSPLFIVTSSHRHHVFRPHHYRHHITPLHSIQSSIKSHHCPPPP